MPSSAPLIFERPPAVWPLLAKAVLARRPRLLAPGQTVPALEARLAPRTPDLHLLEAYREVCGFDPDGKLPITYPHALAGPIHLALLTGEGFPLKLLGLVHLRDRIETVRSIGELEPLEVRCRVGGHRETDRGQEIDLITEARAGGQLAWTEIQTLLARRPGSRPPRPPAGPVAPNEAHTATWSLASDLGRRYARVSGDYNPIHLSGATARLFGFRRAIAHGMWTLARAAAELQPQVAGGAAVLEVTFRLPVLLPGRVIFRSWSRPPGVGFALLDAAGERPHAVGTFGPG
jgi:acyl dehydratase